MRSNNFNEIIGNIKFNDFVSIKFNEDDKCIKTNGVVKKIDKENKLLYVLNSKIPFDEIIEIKKCCNEI